MNFMPQVLDGISWAMLLVGGGFAIISGVGLFRMPEFFTRTHAAGMTDSMAAMLILGGLLLQAPDWAVAVRLLIIAAFLALTSPTASHALAQAALADGLKPLLGGQSDTAGKPSAQAGKR